MLLLVKCILAYAHIDIYPSSSSIDWENWSHITLSDITRMASNTIGERLSRICVEVLPRPNKADDPRNKFVEGRNIYTKFQPLVQRAVLSWITNISLRDAPWGRNGRLPTPNST